MGVHLNVAEKSNVKENQRPLPTIEIIYFLPYSHDYFTNSYALLSITHIPAIIKTKSI